MDTNEQTFRHSSNKLFFMFIVGAFLAFLGFSDARINYCCFSIAGIILVIALSFTTSRVKISTDEITTTRLLGSKSLRWSEIARISVLGTMLRLHSRDEDVTLSIDPQLDDYNEILDIVFSVRTDLLDGNENNAMLSSSLRNIVILTGGLFIIAISIVLFFVLEGLDKFVSLPLLALGAYILANWYLAPRSLTLQGENLVVGYLYKEESYSVDDINSISYERKSKQKSGYINHVQIDLRSGDNIQFSSFEHGNAFAYQILKRWREKASQFA